MKCTKCGNELRYDTEQVGVDKQNVPIFHKFSYCDTCYLKWDLDLPNKNEKKKDSVLSIVAVVLSLFNITFFIGLIIGLIDVCMNDKTKRHLGSWFAIVISLIYLFATGGQILEIIIQ